MFCPEGQQLRLVAGTSTAAVVRGTVAMRVQLIVARDTRTLCSVERFDLLSNRRYRTDMDLIGPASVLSSLSFLSAMEWLAVGWRVGREILTYGPMFVCAQSARREGYDDLYRTSPDLPRL